jgi:hypothetical protein
MNTENKSFRHYGETRRARESGNAMIYVIIVIALFAALSFILSRNSDTGESGAITTEKVNINATQIMQSASQVAQAVGQMTYTGTPLADLDFIPPSDGNFEDPPLRNKVFHPSGGGVTLPRIPMEAIREVDTVIDPGFYLGRFNNVEWSLDDALGNPIDDAVLVAYQISQPICARINQQLTGSPNIPVLARAASAIFIDNGTSSNADFAIADCAACEGQVTLCVADDATTGPWSFYSLILAQPPLIDD